MLKPDVGAIAANWRLVRIAVIQIDIDFALTANVCFDGPRCDIACRDEWRLRAVQSFAVGRIGPLCFSF